MNRLNLIIDKNEFGFYFLKDYVNKKDYQILCCIDPIDDFVDRQWVIDDIFNFRMNRRFGDKI